MIWRILQHLVKFERKDKLLISCLIQYIFHTQANEGDKFLKPGDRFIPKTPSYKDTNDLVVLDLPEEEENSRLFQELFVDSPLERHFDAICDNDSFKVLY